MKTQIKLTVLAIQLIGDGKIAVMTKPSRTNPSPNGVHVLNAAQAKRLSERTLGVDNIIGLKHLVELSNGSAVLTIDAEECKAGDAYTKSDKSTGTYTKDWTKFSNHEMKLGVAAQMKLAELSLANSFNQVQTQSAPKSQPTVIAEVVTEEEEPTA